jgi:hypothetical protein
MHAAVLACRAATVSSYICAIFESCVPASACAACGKTCVCRNKLELPLLHFMYNASFVSLACYAA